MFFGNVDGFCGCGNSGAGGLEVRKDVCRDLNPDRLAIGATMSFAGYAASSVFSRLNKALSGLKGIEDVEVEVLDKRYGFAKSDENLRRWVLLDLKSQKAVDSGRVYSISVDLLLTMKPDVDVSVIVKVLKFLNGLGSVNCHDMWFDAVMLDEDETLNQIRKEVGEAARKEADASIEGIGLKVSGVSSIRYEDIAHGGTAKQIDFLEIRDEEELGADSVSEEPKEAEKSEAVQEADSNEGYDEQAKKFLDAIDRLNELSASVDTLEKQLETLKAEKKDALDDEFYTFLAFRIKDKKYFVKAKMTVTFTVSAKEAKNGSNKSKDRA